MDAANCTAEAKDTLAPSRVALVPQAAERDKGAAGRHSPGVPDL
jgi:hypothetical protein